MFVVMKAAAVLATASGLASRLRTNLLPGMHAHNLVVTPEPYTTVAWHVPLIVVRCGGHLPEAE